MNKADTVMQQHEKQALESATPLTMCCPAEDALNGLIVQVLPGTSLATKELRRQVMAFCSNPAARALLLRGPVGSGKSTLARLIAFGKRIAPLRQESAEQLMANVRWEAPGLIDLRSEMSYYVELTVTGLVETLASSQLFGHKKGAFTGAIAKSQGVFEIAASGHDGDPESGAGVTGGVVFLDEIADIPLSLQAKLLPVLSGGQFYRVGGEGERDHSLEYKGIVIGASWQDLDDRRMRRDLLSRLSAMTIEIPSLNERPDDLPAIATQIEGHVIRRLESRIEGFHISDPKVDRAFYEQLQDNCRPLSPKIIERLAKIDWSRHGELRGVTQVVERVVIGGEKVDSVLENLPSGGPQKLATKSPSDLFVDALLGHTAQGSGLAHHVRTVELDQRATLKTLISTNPTVVRELADHLNISESRLRKQAGELARARSTRKSNKDQDD